MLHAVAGEPGRERGWFKPLGFPTIGIPMASRKRRQQQGKERSMKRTLQSCLVYGLAAVGATGLATGPAQAWEPTKTVEFVVPAGTGGGADQMARMIQGIVQKHNLMPVSMVVVNKSGGAGAEGFMDVVQDQGDDYKLIITLSNLFTTPLATGVPFSWEDMTPVAMLALDNFVLWVNSSAEYATAEDYINAVKSGDANKFQMGGTGSKQEDQIITAAIEQGTGAKFTYVPFKGGGDVAAQLVGGHISSSVNNPIEQVSHWQAGATKPLCVFAAERLSVEGTDVKWGDIPTCKEAGLDIQYQMLRGIFMPAGVDQEVVDYYVDLFQKVRETSEWKDFVAKGAFSNTFMSGDEYKAWVADAAEVHKNLMTNAGFLAK
jgi:tripartite-type tricarboxylate transporter receptor subunit TctC